MADTLPLPSPNRRKLIFAGIIFACFLLILAGFLALSPTTKSDNAKGFNPESKEVVVWTVNMPSMLLEELNKGYNKYLDRSDMKVKSRDFGSYEDLLEVFQRAVQAGESPDVVVVANHGGYSYLDPYIVSLGENIIDLSDFEDRFHPLFVDELIFEEKQKVDGTDKIVRWLKGIPVGFEPMGIYYNRELMPKSPVFWDMMADSLSDDAKTAGIPAISLGYGRATPLAWDILPLLTIQEKGESFNTYKKIDTIESRTTIDRLLKYRLEPNNLRQYQDAYDNTLTVADLFVRGKVATLVGYPSTERDILLAQKRAKKDKELADNFEKNLRWTTIPQTEEEAKKQTNLARYMYFGMAKYGKNRNFDKPSNDPVIKFMQYMATSNAQVTFFDNYEYYLPSQISLLKSKEDAQIDKKTGTFNMTVKDWYVATQKFIPYDMGMTHLFSDIVAKALDEPGATSSVIAGNILSFLNCRIKHLVDPDTYEQPCGCRNDVQSNNNNYWPVCQWGV